MFIIAGWMFRMICLILNLLNMYNDRSFQTQIIRDDLRLRKAIKKQYQRREVKKSGRSKTKDYLVVFLDTSSIHGLNHLVAPKRHVSEYLLWFLVIALSLFGTIYLSSFTWSRYQESPTVVSMDRDMFAWNTTFPCLTICPFEQIDQGKLKEYVDASTEPDKELLTNFILFLANTTFDTFNTIPKYNGIPPNEFQELILNLSATFNPLRFVAAENMVLTMQQSITEMGLCYSLNSKIAVYLSPDYILENKWDLMEHYNETFYVHPLDGEVYARLSSFSTGYKAYIHGPLEIPDISTKFLYSIANDYLLVYVTALTVYTAPDAANLSVAQRKCRFFEENNLKHNPVYSYNLCRIECRIKLCLELCDCIPHFYRKIGDEKVCDVEGLQCLSGWKVLLQTLLYENNTKVCNCLPNCYDVSYVNQSVSVPENDHSDTNLQWGIVTYPRMRYRRDVIYGFTDVLVAVGSMAGLFLGCSVLSFMEIIYFLTLRLVCYYNNNFND